MIRSAFAVLHSIQRACVWRAIAIVLTIAFTHFAGAHPPGAARGRITNAVTGHGIEGARFWLDQAPPDGRAEYERSTDPFGMVALESVAPANYRLTVDHPGYATHQEDVAVASGADLIRSIALRPVPGAGSDPGDAGFDIYVDVSDVASSLKLSGVTVEADRFAQATDAAPASRLSVRTDTNGFVVFRGLRPGFYTFRANRDRHQTGWEAHEATDRRWLDRPHAAHLLLEPIPHTFTVQVQGFHPATESVTTLTNVYVELTGVDPRRPERAVVQTMTGITEANGEALFTGLTPIAHTVRVKRLGYVPKTELIPASALNNTTPRVINLDLEPRSLVVTLLSPYTSSNILADLPVRLQGRKDSNTEGIDRSQRIGSTPHQRRFSNLIPGTYSVIVDGVPGTNNPSPVKPQFQAVEAVDLFAAGDTALSLNLTVTPAVIRGQLFAADETAVLAQPGNPDALLFGRPVYHPRAVDRIQLWEFEDDPLVPLGQSIITVATDADGNFSFSVLPSRYGLYLPGMSNHWGSHVILAPEQLNSDATSSAAVSAIKLRAEPDRPSNWPPAGNPALATLPATNSPTGKTAFMLPGQGWPLRGHWPYPGTPPRNGTAHPGYPLVLNSATYTLEAFVHREVATIAGTVSHNPFAEPTGNMLLARQEEPFMETTADYSDVAGGGGTATLTSLQSGQTWTTPLLSTGANLTDQYRFTSIPPGSYRVDFAHPRFTFPLPRPTVLVSTWAARPGALPVSDPGAGLFFPPLSTIPAGLSGLITPSAVYRPSTTKLQWEVQRWNEEVDPPRYDPLPSASTQVDIIFIAPAYTPGRIFKNPSVLPVGPFTYWARVSGALYRGQIASEGENATHPIYLGGPSDNTSDTVLPTARYNLTYRAVNVADPFELIPDIAITLKPAGEFTLPTILTTKTTDQTLAGYAGPLEIRSVVDQQSDWEWAFTVDPLHPTLPVFQTNYLAGLVVTEASSPTAVITVKMRRPLHPSSTVESAHPGQSVVAARLHISDRFGNRLAATNAPTGPQHLAPALGAHTNASQALFVDVKVPGFKPQRQRVAPTNSQPTFTATLEPLPSPIIDSVTVDRFGRFLPQVSRSGDQSLLNALEARRALTFAWTLRARAQRFTNTLPHYDSAHGATGEATTTASLDPIREVWLIHPFRYRTNFYDEIPTPLTLPADTNDHAAVLAWLDRAKFLPGVFRQGVANFQTNADETEIVATGTNLLSRLPADDFDPVFVIVTRGGATAIRKGFAYPSPAHVLHGVRQPKWLTVALEVMGVIHGTQATVHTLNDVLPFGPVRALPQFTAAIALNDDEPFVSYNYRLDCLLTEGAPTPQDGFLLLGPNTLGITAQAFMDFGLNVRAPGQMHLQIGAGAQKEVEWQDYLPAGLLPLKDPTGSFDARVSTLGALNYSASQEQRYEFELEHEAGGSVNLRTEVDLSDYITAVPTVGGIVRLLHESGLAQVFGILRGGIGLNATRTWRTTFPPLRDTTTTSDPKPHVLRRGLFGQDESRTTKATRFDLCFNLGAGLRLTALDSRIGAAAEIALEGSNPKCPHPSLNATVNPHADWPFLERIQGAVNLNFSASLDLWVVQLGKEWSYEALGFTNELTTSPSFSLVPMRIVTRTSGPAGAAPAVFHPTTSTPIENLFPAGDFSAASSIPETNPAQLNTPTSLDSMVFTDVAPSGRMELKVAERSRSGAWSLPKTIATAGGILDPDIAPLSSGGWMAVWTEVAAEEVGQPFPSSLLMHAFSDASGAQWSAPSPVVRLPDVATEKKLFSAPQFTGLVYARTGRGPKANRFDLEATRWDGAQWSAPIRLNGDIPIRRFDVALVSPPQAFADGAPSALVGMSDGDGRLRSVTWDGLAASNPVLITVQANGAFALTATENGSVAAAVAEGSNGSAIGLFSFTAASGWSRLSALSNLVAISEVAVAAGAESTAPWLVAWTHGGTSSAISYAFTSNRGDLLSGPSVLTSNEIGVFRKVKLLPETARRMRVLARFDDRGSSVRELRIPPGDGTPSLHLEAPTHLADGSIQFTVTGSSSGPVQVQVSVDLRDWRDLPDQSSMSLPFVVRLGAQAWQPASFYRAVIK